MGYREQEALKQFREEEAERERLEEERRLAPIREAEQQFNKTAKELRDIQRENVLKLKDDQFYVSPELVGAKMTWPEANKFNAEQARLFTESTPEYFPCEQNHRALVDYIAERNGINIIDAATWKAAFQRLNSLGLMIHKPAPEPEPIREQVPEHVEPVREPTRFIGIDLSTGLEREFSQFEIERMDSGTYRRTFRLHSIYGRQIDPRTREEAI